MNLKCFIVNAFAESFACGNPAGVIIHDTELTTNQMQVIATDFGKSETAFLREIDNTTYEIRWFTPLKEVGLCGHASLAASKVLNHITNLKEFKFKYLDGVFSINVDGSDLIHIEFPMDHYVNINIDERFYSFFGNIPIIECIKGKRTGKVVLIVEDTCDLSAINPKFELMKNEVGVFNNGIGITKLSQVYDCETRYFNPWFGVNEDHVTGSVHTVIAKYVYDKTGKRNIKAHQASPRPGNILISIIDERVILAGKAKIVFEGQVYL